MSTTRAQLLSQVNGYLHRTDLPVDFGTVAADGQGFIDRANQRVGQDFRTEANLQIATLVSGNTYLLPADFKEAQAVYAPGSSGIYALQPLSTSETINYQSAGGGLPYGYRINGGYLVPTPATSNNITLYYYAALALGTSGSSTNLLLDTYTLAYIWYCLMQAMLYVGASEEAMNYLKLYIDEKDRANAVGRQMMQPVASVVGTTGTVNVAT